MFIPFHLTISPILSIILCHFSIFYFHHGPLLYAILLCVLFHFLYSIIDQISCIFRLAPKSFPKTSSEWSILCTLHLTGKIGHMIATANGVRAICSHHETARAVPVGIIVFTRHVVHIPEDTLWLATIFVRMCQGERHKISTQLKGLVELVILHDTGSNDLRVDQPGNGFVRSAHPQKSLSSRYM